MASDIMMRSVKMYWIVVDEEVKSTHVAEVPTATAGSMPVRRKKGDKIRPPPTPTRPASRPVITATAWYVTTPSGCQPKLLATKPKCTVIAMQDQMGRPH